MNSCETNHTNETDTEQVEEPKIKCPLTQIVEKCSMPPPGPPGPPGPSGPPGFLLDDTDSESISDINFHSKHWRAQFFEGMKKQDFKPQEWSTLASPSKDDGYTSVSTYTVDGLTYSLFSNACFSTKSMHMTLFYKSREEGEKVVKQLEEMPAYYSWKQWHNFKVNVSPIDKDISNEEGTWLIDPPDGLNIAHYTETINTLVAYVLHTYNFPLMNRIYVLRDPDSNNWRATYKNVVNEFIKHSKHSIDILDRNDFQKSSINKKLCFSRLGLLGVVFHMGWGGVYLSPRDSDYIRAMTYIHLGLQPTYQIRRKYSHARGPHAFQGKRLGDDKIIDNNIPTYLRDFDGLLNITFIQRSAHSRYNSLRINRNIQNLDEIYNRLQTDFKNQYTITRATYESKTFKEQVQIALQTDIFITTVGSALVNSIFALPYSAQIIIYPVNTKHVFFSHFSVMSNIYYFPLFNFSQPKLPKACTTFSFDSMGFFGGKDCRGPLERSYFDTNPYIDSFNLLSTLEIASNYVYVNKYHL
ncbi:hypothetical protein WA158_002516 [Blastocystis sp. Blastoise]